MFGLVAINEEVQCSIPGSPFRFFSSEESFHGKYGLGVSKFQYPLSMFCPVLSSEQSLALSWSQIREGPLIVSVFL